MKAKRIDPQYHLIHIVRFEMRMEKPETHEVHEDIRHVVVLQASSADSAIAGAKLALLGPPAVSISPFEDNDDEYFLVSLKAIEVRRTFVGGRLKQLGEGTNIVIIEEE